MRLTHGTLTRRLPRAVVKPGDVVVIKTCYCGSAPDEHFVTPATMESGDDGGIRRLTRTFKRRRDAVAAAWGVLAQTGGRLLDWQRGTLAEQPYLWRVRLRGELVAAEDWTLFERRKRGERQLIDAISAWAGLPKADARTLARLLIARGGPLYGCTGSAVYPLTQTETRQAMVPLDQRDDATRRVLSAWTLIEASPAETLPAPLRGPAT